MRLLLKSTFFISAFFFLLNSNAQVHQGYLVKISGDTIRGEIFDQGDKLNSEICQFRESPESKWKKFSPSEILYYGFAGPKLYEAQKLNIRNREMNLFLEYLVDGIVDLFYANIDSRPTYFMENEDGTLQILSNTEFKVQEDEKSFIKEKKEYVGTLKMIFSDDLISTQKAEQSKLNHKSLVNVTKFYHNRVCDDYSCKVYTGRTNPPLVLLGPAFTYSSNRWSVGILGSTQSKETNRRFGIQFGLFYGMLQEVYNDYSIGLISYDHRGGFEVTLSQLKGSINGKFIFRNNKAEYSVVFGFEPAYVLSAKQDLIDAKSVETIFATSTALGIQGQYPFGNNYILARIVGSTYSTEIRAINNSDTRYDIPIFDPAISFSLAYLLNIEK